MEALPVEEKLRPLKGFKLNFSANQGFRKFFFAAHCKCGTAALLSVEVAREKSSDEVKAALPALVERLRAQTRAFYTMSCDAHTRMRTGAISALGKTKR